MEVKQIATLINDVTSEVIGEEALQTEDLSNIVDVGTQVFNANATENFAHTLVDHIGKMIFVDRKYRGGAPSVVMDGWEYGSVLEKVSMDEIPEAEENESWELTDGTSYDPNIFYGSKVKTKFFNKKVTFEIPRSFTERQLKSAFSNATQMNAFVSMIHNAIDKSLTVKIDSLIMRTLNNMMGMTLYSDFAGADPGASTGVKAINLLYKYNTEVATASPITAEAARFDPEFNRYATLQMGLTLNRMTRISKLFNIEGADRFTTPDMLHVVLLNDFAQAAKAYLQSDTFHDELVSLPKHEVVPYWQGPGEDFAWEDVSKIKILATDGTNKRSIELSGILGCAFDRDALGVSNVDRRVTTQYNAKGEFWNNFYKFDAGYFNAFDEQFVLFYVADEET